MRIGFVVNRLRDLRSTYTTTHLAAAASRRGHRVLFIEIDALTLDPGDRLLAMGTLVPARIGNPDQLTAAARDIPRGIVDLEQLDGLLLRNNPVRRTVLDFGRLLCSRGVPVLNDPDGIAAGAGKLFAQALPRHLRPRTVVTRDLEVIEAFRRELDGPGVLKPVRGSGGRGVTLVHPGEPLRLEGGLKRFADSRDGYLVFQEYLPGAADGDKRILLVEGEPAGCYVRMRREGEFRHNVHVGGRPEPANVDDRDREICAALAGPLRRDGIFLAGLDVIDRRAVEVNVVAPGGVANIERTSGRSVADGIVERLESRLHEGRAPGNRRPASQMGGARRTTSGPTPGSSSSDQGHADVPGRGGNAIT